MENYEIIKDDVSSVITGTQERISLCQKNLKNEAAKLKDAEEIKKELNKIKNQIDSYKQVVNTIIGLFIAIDEYLEEQQKELDQSKIVLLKRGLDQLIELIHINLPDGMELKQVEGCNEWKIVLSSLGFNLTTNKKSKKIYTFSKNEFVVGELLLVENNNELVVKIKMQDDEDYQDFKVDSTLRVFPIINHVITKFNYREETK